jgi:hypothetical protein
MECNMSAPRGNQMILYRTHVSTLTLVLAEWRQWVSDVTS